jgi:hypothetical protein
LDLILRPWLDTHPGTPFTFFHAKPSHDIECGYDQLTKDQASYYFKRLLKDSTTEEMRRRYRHLFPSTQQDAMKQLFQ